MSRNQGRKGKPLGPYRSRPRASARICLLTEDQLLSDQFSDVLSALLDLPPGARPAWLDEDLRNLVPEEAA